MIKLDVFSKFVDSDDLDTEYFKITSDILAVSDTNHALDVIFRYHRKHGFPHYNVPHHAKLQQLRSLIRFDEMSLFADKKIDQTMHCLSLAWTYFPHWVEVECGNNTMRPIDYWNNDDKLREIIRKTWAWQLKHGNGIFTLNRLRQNFKIYGGNQSVSNFRPSAAKFIYNTYGNGGTILDMSCGWGGRLTGFLASNCKTYIGTDPSSKTFDGLLQLVDELNVSKKDIRIHKLGSEVFRPEAETIDCAFTSPPYFDTEKYSQEDTQSFKKYPTIDGWINGFLNDTVANVYYGLKPDGHMLLNIANTRRYVNIESETIRVCITNGFKHVDTLYLILSSVSGKGQKLEPIFVFQK